MIGKASLDILDQMQNIILQKNSLLDYSVLICRKNASDEGKWWHGFAGARS